MFIGTKEMVAHPEGVEIPEAYFIRL